MGQRAVFGFKFGNNVSLTTVQWSTQLPKNMRLVLEKTAPENQENLLTTIFCELSLYDHVSTLELLTEEDLKDPYYAQSINDLGIRIEDKGKEYTLVITGYPADNPTVEKTTRDISEIVKNHGHAQDGFSMWYDKNTGEFQVWANELYFGDKKFVQENTFNMKI